METKKCSSCKVRKELGEFHKNKAQPDGKCTECKICKRDNRRKREALKPKKPKKPVVYKYGIPYNQSEQGKRDIRNNRYKKVYGITLQEYEEMFEDQGGLCAICGKPETQVFGPTGVIKHLAIDHNHETNKVRGLLCNACNKAIGLLQDDVNILNLAIKYLETT